MQRRERSLPTGVDTGGRHMRMGATILIQRHTEVIITARAMVIIMRRLITTLPRELMAGNRLLTALMGQQRAELLTTLTPGLTRAAPVFRHLTAAEVQHRLITPTPEPTLKPDKARTQTRNGVALTSREETRVLPWAIIQLPMVR